MSGYVAVPLALFVLLMTIGHISGAVEYGKAKKLPSFVTLALTIFMLFGGWVLFAIGMAFRGYDVFWDSTWPTTPSAGKRAS